ncbi:hypothetical protein [Bradyrhizobium genosp. P]|uniref:hypothetical protein n=1 Tax=Bradyrhizobium genosp. P TaxID=83641 RepID=UPI003CF76C6D
MSQKQPLATIIVSNPSAFSGRGYGIILEYADDDAALRAAQKIASETGRRVTVHDESARLIGTIPASTIH